MHIRATPPDYQRGLDPGYLARAAAGCGGGAGVCGSAGGGAGARAGGAGLLSIEQAVLVVGITCDVARATPALAANRERESVRVSELGGRRKQPCPFMEAATLFIRYYDD